MDLSGLEAKKRKLEDNGAMINPSNQIATTTEPGTGGAGALTTAIGVAIAGDTEKPPSTDFNGADVPSYLNTDDVRRIADLLSKDELVQIVSGAMLCHRDVLEEVRRLADRDPAHRKIFVRGLGWETNTASLRNTFSEYGELEEAIAIMDKNTGKSRGYGFVTFKHIDSAIYALKEPSKRIDGRISVCQLASLGPGASQPPQDVAARKIYVGNVPMDWPVDRMLSIFSEYGEIEEGPLGLDKQVGKARGYALFIYKTAEGAKRALEEPVKNINGHQLFCKLAAEGSKQRAQMHSQQDMYDQAGPAGSNMGYGGGGGQYGAGPQGMMQQSGPYGQNPSMMNSGMNPGMHPGIAGSLSTPPVGGNSMLASSMNAPHGQTGLGQVGSAMGLPSYGSQGALDPYGPQVASYAGQHGSYSSISGPTSMYNAPPASQNSAPQSQYGLSPYHSQQQVSSYQGQQQVGVSYQTQQPAVASTQRVQQSGVPSMPYYGM